MPTERLWNNEAFMMILIVYNLEVVTLTMPSEKSLP